MYDFNINAAAHREDRPWAETVKATATEMAYADADVLHEKLTAAGWSAEEAHFILEAAAFYVVQRAQAAE